ncbi:MAG: nicotinate-nucleotide adenylyltransferase [Deltaproteobacteria bacterium]|nr:nicotinate-nucleotide adenylyltransferase [Deltaproteobacteria bacterium]MCK5422431.1 nicotinate-nucleotide adenylyltransferase [Deltaproteobacteria bacterium]
MNLKVSNLLKLGIMGGTFDPIHLGHIKVAEIVRTQFSLENVIFVPARCPPHKSINDITPAEHRYAMVELAIKDIPYFQPSPIEMERSCPSYAGDTIKALKEKYGDNWQIYFITGLDALLTIINWDRSRTYPGLCQFIAATRPGYDQESINKRIPDNFFPYITIIEEPNLSISSTAIRSRVRAHQSIDEMVPEDVRNYIITRGLYQGKKLILE